jgi:hypothetical protein
LLRRFVLLHQRSHLAAHAADRQAAAAVPQRAEGLAEVVAPGFGGCDRALPKKASETPRNKLTYIY